MLFRNLTLSGQRHIFFKDTLQKVVEYFIKNALLYNAQFLGRSQNIFVTPRGKRHGSLKSVWLNALNGKIQFELLSCLNLRWVEQTQKLHPIYPTKQFLFFLINSPHLPTLLWVSSFFHAQSVNVYISTYGYFHSFAFI